MDTEYLLSELINKINSGDLTYEQLAHLMSVCEVEIVNRMAAEFGYVYEE